VDKQEKQDRIFDGLAGRFSQRIYSNLKGKIRLDIVQADILKHIPLSNDARILDMGGGLGQMSIWLAQQGYHVTLAEPSTDMLAIAKKQITELQLDAFIDIKQCSIQELIQTDSTQYDVILLHAVLEWLATPKETLQALLSRLLPQGYLSLLFYNQQSAIMRSLLVADFKRIENNQIAAMGEKGFTPISPHTPEHVIDWTKQWQMQLIHWSGVRTFFDYMRPEARKLLEENPQKQDELIAMETYYSQQEPWRSLARYQHLILKK
jgi:S-adenosylmethionine-dependent methyltransferase